MFKHIVGSLIGLFISYQLHISYTKYEKFFLRSLIKEKVCHYLSGDIERRGSKISHFHGGVIFE